MLIFSIISLVINLKYIDGVMNKSVKNRGVYSWNVIMIINLFVLILVGIFSILEINKVFENCECDCIINCLCNICECFRNCKKKIQKIIIKLII